MTEQTALLSGARLRRFNANHVPVTEAGCWLWIGAIRALGRKNNEVRPFLGNTLAHRAAWELLRGPIPEGLLVCHKCDTPLCVNPDHLYVGTRDDNAADRVKRDRSARMYGEDSPNTELTAQDVRNIRALSSAGMEYRSIARAYPISPESVSNIVRRKTWSKVA